MKKHIYLVLAIIATLCLSMFFVACSCNPDNGDKEPETTINVNINKTNVNMILGFTDNLSVIYDKTEGYSLTWSTSDASIVTVNDGKLEAMKQGTATITATYSNGTDSYSDTANVVVGLGGNVPVLCIENNVDESTWNLLKGESVEFVPYVYFNGVKFYDVDVTASISDDSVITYTNNTITAGGIGGTSIVIKGSWRGIEFNGKNAMGVSLTVNVLNNFEMSLNNNAVPDVIELYTIDSWGENSYITSMPFVLGMKDEGVVSTNPVDVTIANENIVSYDNGVLSQNTFGETEITLSWTSDSGVDFEKKITAIVRRPVDYFEKEIQYFSGLDGVALYDIDNDGKYEESTLAQVFFGENTDKVLLDATQTYHNIATNSTIENDVLTISDNSVNGVYTHDSGMQDVTLTVGTATEIYVVNVKSCAKVFAQDNVDEFLTTFTHKDGDIGYTAYKDGGVVEKYVYYYKHTNGQMRHRGYYTLCEDLDMTGIISTANYDHRFAGVFDGAGHVISNLSFAGSSSISGCGGIFGRLNGVIDLTKTGAIIKNVAFTGVNFNGPNCRVLGYQANTASSSSRVKISDVYIQINKQSTFQNGCSPTFYETQYIDYTNVIIDYQVEDSYEFSTASDAKYGSLFISMYNNAFNLKAKSLYVISSAKLLYHAEKVQSSPDKYPLDAENVPGDDFVKVEGASRYDTIENMKADTDNDYSTFSADYWTIKEGIPVWKALA